MEKRTGLLIITILLLGSSLLIINNSLPDTTTPIAFIIKEISTYLKETFKVLEKEGKLAEEKLSPEDSDNCNLTPIPGTIYIKFKENSGLKTKENIEEKVQLLINSKNKIVKPLDTSRAFGISKDLKKQVVQTKVGLDRWVKITLEKNLDVLAEAEKWKSLPEVEEVDFDYEPCLLLYPSESNRWTFTGQWHHENNGTVFAGAVPDADVDSIDAWDYTVGNEIIVAAPDTSVFWNHEDLIQNIWQNLGEDADGDGTVIQENGTETIFYYNLDGILKNRTYVKYIFDPGDINGVDDDDWDNNPSTYIDDFIGWDFLSNDNDPTPDSGDSDEYKWHGTQTSGLIAARGNNSIGGSGICWNCKMIAMRRAVGSGIAVQYALENGAKIISMSWLGSYYGTLKDALNYAHEIGALSFAGIGNSGSSTSQNSLCNSEYVNCVAGSTAYNTVWLDSTYGHKSDFAAPASTVLAPVYYNHPLNIYVYASGTSLASPIAAGVGALILSLNSNLTSDEAISIMQSSTKELLNPNNRYIGNGQLSAKNALDLVNHSLSLNGHFPIAIINVSGTTYTTTTLKFSGTANATNFSNYKIWYGMGSYPTNWTLWKTSTMPVGGGLGIFNLSLNGLPFGIGQIKLTTTDDYNQTAYDTYYFEHLGSCTPGQTTPCGSGVCQGIRNCLSDGNWSSCSTEGLDSGICSICDVDGDNIFDVSQVNDCNDSIECTVDYCSNINYCVNDDSNCEPSQSFNYTNQTILISPGWNLISIKLVNNSITSKDLDSSLVMKYENNNWVMDLKGNNEFNLNLLEGYYVYSTSSKIIHLSGEQLTQNERLELVENSWNLFTINSTRSYSEIYPEHISGTFSLYETNGFQHILISDYGSQLDQEGFYWANLKAPDLSPPKLISGSKSL